MFKVIAKFVLTKAREVLRRLSSDSVRQIACAINKKVDIPNLSEDAEYALIYAALDTSLRVTIELLDNVKI